MAKPIYVTRPFLPPLEELVPFLEDIWENKMLTNGGPFHQRFEDELAAYLGVSHLSLFTSGTLGLITALQALQITGEVITTPYTFVATSHALTWNGVKPVFVDIDPSTLTLDPSKIEAAITPLTTAIMPVHVYGVPCAMDEIERIAKDYGLKVIYDAAHTFGVRLQDGASLCARGDVSVLSFHATKVFTTFEGGAVICQDAETKQRIDDLKNFGFVDEITNIAPGINAKMNEMQAALGLLQLNHFQEAIDRRARVFHRYLDAFATVPGLRLHAVPPELTYNYSYFPVFIEDGYPVERDELYHRLMKQGIFARRYFYPLVSDFPMYREQPSAAASNLPVASDVAGRVLCLPIYPDLTPAEQDRVIDIVTTTAGLGQSGHDARILYSNGRARRYRAG
jgi:dTDP-4-amino-4,6-dideoxygalactose transaminase